MKLDLENIALVVIAQLALLTRSEQVAIADKIAQIIAIAVKSNETEIDDALVRDVVAPLVGEIAGDVRDKLNAPAL